MATVSFDRFVAVPRHVSESSPAGRSEHLTYSFSKKHRLPGDDDDTGAPSSSSSASSLPVPLSFAAATVLSQRYEPEGAAAPIHCPKRARLDDSDSSDYNDLGNGGGCGSGRDENGENGENDENDDDDCIIHHQSSPSAAAATSGSARSSPSPASHSSYGSTPFAKAETDANHGPALVSMYFAQNDISTPSEEQHYRVAVKQEQQSDIAARLPDSVSVSAANALISFASIATAKALPPSSPSLSPSSSSSSSSSSAITPSLPTSLPGGGSSSSSSSSNRATAAGLPHAGSVLDPRVYQYSSTQDPAAATPALLARTAHGSTITAASSSPAASASLPPRKALPRGRRSTGGHSGTESAPTLLSPVLLSPETPATSADGPAVSEAEKNRLRKEENRLAARRCRERKKWFMSQLQERNAQLEDAFDRMQGYLKDVHALLGYIATNQTDLPEFLRMEIAKLQMHPAAEDVAARLSKSPLSSFADGNHSSGSEEC